MSLKVVLGTSRPSVQRADVLALAIIEGQLDRDAAFGELDKCLNGELRRWVTQLDFKGRLDQVVDVPTLGRLPASRIVLIGVGAEDKLTLARTRHAVAAAIRVAGAMTSHLAWVSPQAEPEQLRAIAEGVILGGYRYTKYLTGERRPKRQLEQVTVLVSGRISVAQRRAAELGRAVGESVNLARDAVNAPPNELTPEALARLASDVARKGQLKSKVLDAAGIDRLGMKLLAAVGRGSRNPPRFVHLSYTPTQRNRRRIVFLGKGLTFDSGGLCIKPAAGMNEMKNDMAGAAAVIGLMSAVAAVKPSVEVHGLVVAAENMPDGDAYRPGDIFGSMDGKTVEIINTDAEGRLALADGLTYAQRLKPDLIIDAATLTGACLVALGKTTSGYFTDNGDWAARFEAAAQVAGESFWRLPLLTELRDQLKSDVADLKHTGERWGGAITAALFLKEFVGNVPWIHCDIAGPAYSERARGIVPKGGTGHPILTFLRLLEGLD